MSEAHEPSYYEIALTNRQVLVAFVVLLLCVLAAFMGGVWLGRSDQGARTGSMATEETSAEDLAALEEFKFFSEQRDDAAHPPDLSQVRRPPPPAEPPPPDRPSRDTTLAEDVGQAEPTRAASPPPPRMEPPPPEVTPPPPPPPKVTPPPPARATTPATAAEPSTGFVIQVFSTKDEAQAKKVREQLTGGGYQAYLSPVKVGSQTMYRVRIGPYPDRPAAEASAGAVNRSFKLDTWVTAAGN